MRCQNRGDINYQIKFTSSYNLNIFFWFLRSGLLTSLVLNLHNVCSEDSGEDEFDKDLAAAWICEIIKALTQNNIKPNEKNSSHNKKAKQIKKKDVRRQPLQIDAPNWKTGIT
jgi:hypothetical protein